MADQQQEQQEAGKASGTYVGPPDWYRLYEPGADAGPKPPALLTSSFTVFGEQFDPNASYYPRLDTERLYDTQADGSTAIKQELLKMNKGLLFLFLELLTVLVQQPSHYAAVLSPILGTLHNMQHLINIARPLQAQETLKCTLLAQIQEKQAALTALRSTAAKAKEDLLSLTKQLAVVGGDAAESVQRPQAADAPAAAQAAPAVLQKAEVQAAAMDLG